MKTSFGQYRRLWVGFGLAILICAGCKPEPARTAAGRKMEDLRQEGPVRNIENVGIFPEDLLQPTDRFVRSAVPETTIQPGTEHPVLNAIGIATYDTRNIGVVSARIAGRIEKLYVRYRFQAVRKGQKLLDLYSPDLLEEQENTLFLLQNDPGNSNLIEASKKRLKRLDMTPQQIENLIQTRRASPNITLYSPYDGHIHDAGQSEQMANAATNMPDEPGETTPELNLREGMYIQADQPVLTVYNTENLWAVLNIPAEQQALVKKGAEVKITAETDPDRIRKSRVDFIEPFFRTGSKTLTVRAVLPNHDRQIPVGARLRADIETSPVEGNWLPRTAVLSLGLTHVALRKTGAAYQAVRVETGLTTTDRIQIISGLSLQDSVAVNAQFLIDSESFVKTSENKQYAPRETKPLKE